MEAQCVSSAANGSDIVATLNPSAIRKFRVGFQIQPPANRPGSITMGDAARRPLTYSSDAAGMEVSVRLLVIGNGPGIIAAIHEVRQVHSGDGHLVR